MSSTNIIFDGSNGISSDTFVRVTRQRSLAEGKEEDEWIALFAASCLEGKALDWYELQDEEVQESWKLLRQALLRRWPRATEIASPSGATSPPLVGQPSIPTPAAAPPPSALSHRSAALPVSNPAPAGNVTQSTGIIQINTKTGDFFGYISRFPNSGRSGGYKITATRQKALIVRADRFGLAHEFVITNSPTSRPTKECLGIFHGNEKIQFNESSEDGNMWWAELVSVAASTSSGRCAPSGFDQMDGATNTWITHISGTVTPVWETPNGALYPLKVLVTNQTPAGDRGTLQVTNDPRGFAEDYLAKGYTFIPVDLTFEIIA